jgi:hypothetical protein
MAGMPELQEHILGKDYCVAVLLALRAVVGYRLQRSKHFVLCRTPSEVLIISFATTEKGFRFKGSLLNNGARGRIRTSDRLVRSQVLYPAELHAHLVVGRYYATRR